MQKALALTAEDTIAGYAAEGCNLQGGTVVGGTGCVHTNGRYAFVVEGTMQANFWNLSATGLACNGEQMRSLVELIQGR